MRDIFDFHLHPFISPENSIVRYGVPADAVSFVNHLKSEGITQCAGSVIHRIDGTDFSEIRKMNDEALRFRDMFPDFYRVGFHVLCNFTDESCAEIERMHSEGVKLIGELVPYYMGYKNYADPSLMPVWKLAESLGMTVSMHPTTLEDMEEVAAACPRLTVVMAHPGENPDYVKKLELMQRRPNMMLDVCGTGLFRYGMLQHGVKTVGANRFLFATDFPTCSVGVQIGGVDAEIMTAHEREMIYSLNAHALLD